MPITFRRESGLRFHLESGTFLYDCHAHKFARDDDGQNFALGFVPFYHSMLFGVPPGAWQQFVVEQERTIAALPPADRDAYIRALGPRRSAQDAARLAFFAFPRAERFLKVVEGAEGPFVLRDEFLFPRHQPLSGIEGLAPGAEDWSPIGPGSLLCDEGGRAAARRAIAGLARGDRERGDFDDDAAALVDAALSAGLVGPSTDAALPRPPAGVYVVGHSALLVRGERTGLLIDPIMLSDLARHPRAFSIAELHRLVDAVALTHGHFDHYHLPTLLAYGDVPVHVPRVGRASIVCEDLALRLRSFGPREVGAPAWGSTFSIGGEITVHVLPFYGEQFLTSERYPEARNWGNCYVVEVQGRRVFVAADAGFEPGQSVIALAEAWCAEHGPIDVVAAQSIALHSSFGVGDPDLQLTGLTCANRAPEAFLLARREARITLGVEDIPALCARVGAKHFVPYGQFQYARGAAGCSPQLASRLADALGTARSTTTLRALEIGQGLSFGSPAAGPVSLAARS